MKTIQKLTIAAVAIVSMNSCCAQNDKPKFDAKEYAKHKTERIDNIVELSDAQEKEVYALYLAQGKEIKKNIKAAKKECGEMKRPDCKKAEGCDKAKCDKPCPKKAECCDKAKCDKPCPKKAECCDKAKCDKPCPKKAECCDKAKCDKPCPKKAEGCDKAKCDQPCPKKAECCDKAKCDKPCPKKAECCDKAKCDKPCPKKAECAKPHKPMRRHHFVSPESKKATFEKLNTILTPEQSAKLKELHTKRHSHCSEGKECIPTPAEK